jgi:hypothetical protein
MGLYEGGEAHSRRQGHDARRLQQPPILLAKLAACTHSDVTESNAAYDFTDRKVCYLSVNSTTVRKMRT